MFIAIGLPRIDLRRAARELLTLFARRWGSGKVPHIVFNPKAPSESFFLGPDYCRNSWQPGWDCWPPASISTHMEGADTLIAIEQGE